MSTAKKTVSGAQLDTLIKDSLELLKKDRDREILLRRYGITTGKTQTLEEIGKNLGITRERVRQIEKAAIIKIREQYNHDHALNDVLVALTDKKGGIVGFASLVHELGLDKKLSPHLSFLIKLNPRFTYLDRNDRHSDMLFASDMYDENGIRKIHDELVTVIAGGKKPVKFNKVMTKMSGSHQKEALMELGGASAEISTLESLWGLSLWPEVNPKSIRDKIYLVLKKSGRPMHFTEIAAHIAELPTNPKKVTTQAVHNELIKDSRFVLIGRGIYALGEWGYQAGTVADIIEEILREESPLKKEDIISRVLARRQVKTTTISLNLQEKPQFERAGTGMYKLKADYKPTPSSRRRRGGKKA